jgi:hypothetical protein
LVGGLTAAMLLTSAACGDSDGEADLATISEATVGAANILLMTSDTDSLGMEFNVMRVAGLSVGKDGALVVADEVCFTDFESSDRLGECLGDQRPWESYTVTVPLGALDAATVRVSESDSVLGTTRLTVPVLLADCREDAGDCVDVSLTIPRSLLGVPCHDDEACQQAAVSLKALIDRARGQ